MPPLESSIDDLYKGPLNEFVPGRARLAKTLKGADAQRVKALKKPTLVPWAVNQLYWHARPLFDRLAKTGAAVRAAQIKALSGGSANVRGLSEAHHQAIGEAVAEAARLAARADARPSVEELARMLEAASLRPDLPEPPGRMTKALAPPGFEALAGIAIRPSARAASAPPSSPDPRPVLVPPPAPKDSGENTRRREREDAAAERRRQAEIQKATDVLRRATEAEARTRQAWERAQEERRSAASRLSALRAGKAP